MDGIGSALFVVFVVFLFLGYFNVYPTVPYSGLAAIPLLGSLLTLFWVNWTSNRQAGASASLPAH